MLDTTQAATPALSAATITSADTITPKVIKSVTPEHSLITQASGNHKFYLTKFDPNTKKFNVEKSFTPQNAPASQLSTARGRKNEYAILDLSSSSDYDIIYLTQSKQFVEFSHPHRTPRGLSKLHDIPSSTTPPKSYYVIVGKISGSETVEIVSVNENDATVTTEPGFQKYVFDNSEIYHDHDYLAGNHLVFGLSKFDLSTFTMTYHFAMLKYKHSSKSFVLLGSTSGGNFGTVEYKEIDTVRSILDGGSYFGAVVIKKSAPSGSNQRTMIFFEIEENENIRKIPVEIGYTSTKSFDLWSYDVLSETMVVVTGNPNKINVFKEVKLVKKCFGFANGTHCKTCSQENEPLSCGSCVDGYSLKSDGGCYLDCPSADYVNLDMWSCALRADLPVLAETEFVEDRLKSGASEELDAVFRVRFKDPNGVELTESDFGGAGATSLANFKILDIFDISDLGNKQAVEVAEFKVEKDNSDKKFYLKVKFGQIAFREERDDAELEIKIGLTNQPLPRTGATPNSQIYHLNASAFPMIIKSKVNKPQGPPEPPTVNPVPVTFRFEKEIENVSETLQIASKMIFYGSVIASTASLAFPVDGTMRLVLSSQLLVLVTRLGFINVDFGELGNRVFGKFNKKVKSDISTKDKEELFRYKRGSKGKFEVYFASLLPLREQILVNLGYLISWIFYAVFG